MPSSIGLIGLAVMGQNLALNIADHGFPISIFNRTANTTKQFITDNPHANIQACYNVEELVNSLSKPRIVLLMVKAGEPVDQTITSLLPYLEAGDIIIDGGNSHFDDSGRRLHNLQNQGIHFVGMGISGGEDGARHGPSIMPGGDKAAWPAIKPIFQSIAAQVDGQPCCDWVGDGAAGHYVKMVHNGIEYGDMQLITEAYALLRQLLQLSETELHNTFHQWNQGLLESYLIEITADILNAYEGDTLLLDKVLDVAAQKGTGKWTAVSALDEGTPLSLITEAVYARYLSAQKPLRIEAAKHFSPATNVEHSLNKSKIHDALYAAKILSYTQGFMLLQAKAEAKNWHIDFAAIAKLWRGGCIIRSRFLNDIAAAFDKNSQLPCLIFDDFFKQEIQESLPHWRETVANAFTHGIPVPAMASALSFFDGLRQADSAANLLQAQRDYFGAHTYRRIDAAETENFHSNWAALAKEHS